MCVVDVNDEPTGVRIDRRHALAGVLAATLAAAGCRRATSDADGTDGRGAAETTRSPAPSTAPSSTTAPTPALAPAADRDRDVHLLRRLTYGPTEASLAELRSVGAAAWLDAQLEPSRLGTAAFEAELLDTAPELAQPAGEILSTYRADGNGARLAGVLTITALARHTRSPAQLHERMVEFWGDHFNVPQSSPASTAARLAMDHQVLRPHALGRFDELLVATAQSPAMLLYLNNFQSSVGAINENYAREVLELHTVGVDGGYDEDDIAQVAALLTGWTITRELEFQFVARRHDAGPVDVLGWRRPSSGDPISHGEDFLRHLARLPQTARHVSHKLAVRFVGDDPDPTLVDAMTDAWGDHDTAISPVIRAMVEHPAFVEAPLKFNRPWDYLVQTLRSLDTTFDPSSPLDARRAYETIQDLGQVPFRWPSPDGYADVESAWMHAGGVLARWNVAASIALGDDVFTTGLADRLRGLRGATAAEIHQDLVAWLRPGEHASSVADLTGWSDGDVPDDDDLDDAGRQLAFVLTAGPQAHFR